MRCGQDWQPTVIKRVIDRYESSTEVVLVSTDAGNAYLKGMGNKQGNESLACELVGSELAALVGLNVPPFAIIDLQDLEIETINGRRLAMGPAFLSKAQEKVITGDPEGSCLGRLRNRGDLSLIIAFDTWVRNPDRCPPPDHVIPGPNRDNVMFRSAGGWFELLAFDHTHCFTETDLETDLQGTYFVDDPGVYGALPEFLPYVDEAGLRSACKTIAGIDGAQVMAIVAAVPH
ncbi:HipA family kinase [Novosphingobium nitrogenifigens]|uniref:HipA family kinase n=1 Tax=Novosphingobium nitrogenifigens TaxID=378548 RepID=UPI00036985D7|nr:HipA family kinase [Novosphingobium nitrogenifigens]